MADVPSTPESEKAPKESVNYRPGDDKMQCANCANFSAPDSCALVKSPIEPNGMCDLWSPARDQAAVENQLFLGPQNGNK